MRDEKSDRHDDFELGERLLPGSTEEAVERMVAANPARHGTPLERRIEIARQMATAGDMSGWEQFYEYRVRAIGGDPDEMLPGNKPRYTVDENGDVKDHETGEVHYAGGLRPIGSVGADAGGTGGNGTEGPQSAEPDAPAIDAEGVEQAVEASDGLAADTENETSVPPQGGAPLSEPAGGRDTAQATKDQFPGAGARTEAKCNDEEHDFGEDPAEETRCSKCGVTFLDWAMS